METGVGKFLSIVKNPLKFRLFLFSRLPVGFFTGLKIEAIDAQQCAVSVRYKWFNKNPFRSTYFASLAMAAELSTGALAMANVYEKKPGVSMLVTALRAEYFKKATGKTIFTCCDGQKFFHAVSKTIETAEAQLVEAETTGINQAGEVVAKFVITWSMKARAPK